MTDTKNMIIGIDHGYGYIKTASTITRSGVIRCVTPPALMGNTVQYKEDYYTVGESQKKYLPDKTADDDFYILTLAAIAKELNHRKRSGRNVNLVLAAGLPIEYFAQKKAFINYLQRDKKVSFSFGGKSYFVNISKVLVYPQGYSIVAEHLEEYADCTVIDIGSGTMDVIPFSGKMPVTSQCISLPMGALDCMKDVQAEFRKKFYRQLPELVIQKTMRGLDSGLKGEHLEFVKRTIRKWADKALLALTEAGADLSFTPAAFCGGGAIVMQLYGQCPENTRFVTDIYANAAAFEKLAKACQK